MDRETLYDDAREALLGRRLDAAELELVLREVADGITVQDPSGRLLYANDAAATLIGFESAGELLATPVEEIVRRFEILDELGEPFPLERLPGRIALTGTQPEEQTICYRNVATGEQRWSIVRASPVFDDRGGVRFAINVFQDITELRRTEAASRFLAEAGAVLSESLDYQTTLAQLAALAVPRLGDWCMVYIRQPDGSIERLAVEHAGGLHHDVLPRLRPYRFDPDAEVGVPAVLRTGTSQLYPEATSALVASDVIDSKPLADDLESLGLTSWMCVPLIARGLTLGVISVLAAESGRRFGERDLALAEELARRAALAVDNARLFRDAQHSLSLLDTLFVSAPVAIGFWDRDLRYVRVNDALAELNGLSAEEHIGKTLSEVVPDLAAVLEPVYRRVVDTGEPVVQEESTEWLPQRLGTDRHWLSSYYPVRGLGGEVTGLGAVIMEITERKRAEQEEQFQRKLLELQGEASLDGLLVVSPEGRMISFNQRFAEMWGIPADVLATGSDEAALGIAIEKVADPEAFIRRVDELYADPSAPSREEVVLKDGRVFDRYGSAVRGADGTYFGWLWSFRDVTEQKRVERELEARAQASQALEFVGDGVFLLDRAGVVRLWNPAAETITGLRSRDIVGRLADEAIPGWAGLVSLVPIVAAGALAPARPETLPLELNGRELWLSISGVGFAAGTVFAFRDVTEERGVEKMKSDFVSTVSHELRTPLAAIYGAALTLRRDDLPLEKDQRVELLGVVASEAERLARIVNDILWTSRIETGGLQVSIERTDATILARAVVQAARLHLPPGVTLRLHAPVGLPDLAADPDKARQVLANLVENAVKYSPAGGRIEVRLERHGDRLRFLVTDEGLGVPIAERERIFEKFYRLDPDLTRGVGGTGLGLYICRELVRRMDGSIWMEQRSAKGSTFVVELPLIV